MKFYNSHESTTEKGFKSLCPTCGREVSNAAYFAGAKGSSHLKGTCTVPAWVNVKESQLERLTLRPHNPFAGIFTVNYDRCTCYREGCTGGGEKCKRVFPKFETSADLCKWWKLPSIGEASKPKGKAAQVLAQMGLAA